MKIHVNRGGMPCGGSMYEFLGDMEGYDAITLSAMEIVLEKGPDALNGMGKTNRSGSKFSISTLQVILDNEPLYRGMYRYGKDSEWIEGEHEPILK